MAYPRTVYEKWVADYEKKLRRRLWRRLAVATAGALFILSLPYLLQIAVAVAQ